MTSMIVSVNAYGVQDRSEKYKLGIFGFKINNAL